MITEFSPNSTPKTCSATSRMRSSFPLSPSVADVATGQIFPSGLPGREWFVAAARRRSSIATSVPCAPS